MARADLSALRPGKIRLWDEDKINGLG